jgi:2-polyprenyl-3-methyl-5-hydroxy-6-metoxy-1,4-benzoquinol methylase
MFLSRRSTQAEYSDAPDLSPEHVARNYADLGKINRLFAFAEPFQRSMVNWLGRDQVQSLKILDLGAGDGSLGRALETWARKKNWRWEVTNLDFNESALHLHNVGRNVRGVVTALPFADNSFDLVIASQMTHHIDASQNVIKHFQEAWRVTRNAMFFTDLHRNPALLGMVWLSCIVARLSSEMRADGIISIRRGWRVPEWKHLARAAEIPNARVWLYFGSRIILQARKSKV